MQMGFFSVFRGQKDYQTRNFAFGENSLALRLTSELVDLRAAKPNRILRVGRAEPGLIRE